MTAHVDILEQEESLRRPFYGSLAIHLGLLGAAFVYAMWQGPAFRMGGDTEGGGSTAITPVKGIELPRPTMRENPVSNDTTSKIEERLIKPTRERDDPDAISFRKKQEEKKKKQPELLAEYLRKRTEALKQPQDPSLVGSSTGARASSVLFQPKPGSGGAGMPAGQMGDGFGAYEQYLRECVARNWNTTEVEATLRNAPPVIVKFSIASSGAGSGIRLSQASGNTRLDNSTLRAVEACNPFRPLPAGYPRSSANIEFWFQFQR